MEEDATTDERTAQAFGRLLQQYRLSAGLTQERLAERANLGTRSLQHLERGETRPQRATAQRLAVALALPPTERHAFEALAQPVPRRRDRETANDTPRTAVAASLDSSVHNLPLPVTSFIGREREMVEVTRLLSTTRLLTLTGTGGTGKTRLALEVAAAVRAEYPEGVWLVELAPLTDPAGVPRAVASAVGLHEEAGQPIMATLLAALRPRKILLLLDNCEHLLDACAGLASALIRACPQVRVLATSREALSLAGETAWRVLSLALPHVDPTSPAEVGQVAAVRLFVERAQAVQPDFALDAHNVAAVIQICRRLDGIPLALELAAARLRGLSVEHLAARLDQRFRLLTGGSRAALPRQQTLQATVEWSYNLLSGSEQSLFNRLSVFAGGFTLEAAEAVCADGLVAAEDVLDLLLRLVDRSLVIAEGSGGNVERYRLLETLRQYGRERLLAAGVAAEVYTRHLTYLCRLAEEAHREMVYPHGGAYPVAWRDRLETEHMNIRQALQWALEEGAVQDGLRLAGMLLWYWHDAGLTGEGQMWLTALLALPAAAPRTPARAWALLSLAFIRRSARLLVGAQAVGEQAQALVAESLAIAREVGDKEVMAIGLVLMGRLIAPTAYLVGRALMEESLALCHELESATGIANIHNSLGDLAWEQGDATAARAWWSEGLRLAREGDYQNRSAMHLGDLGMLTYHRGDLETARRQIEESLDLYRAVHERMGISIALGCLGAVTRAQGDTACARACYGEKLALWQRVGDRSGIAATLAELGAVAQQDGDLGQAQFLFAESLILRRELGHPVDVAESLAHLGGLAVAQGDSPKARALYGEGLAMLASTPDRAVAALYLERVAALVLGGGDAEQAARLLGAAATLRQGTFVLFVWDDRMAREQLIAALRAALGEEQFAAAWSAGQAMTEEQAIAAALVAL